MQEGFFSFWLERKEEKEYVFLIQFIEIYSYTQEMKSFYFQWKKIIQTNSEKIQS